jgi:hypothetical protein
VFVLIIDSGTALADALIRFEQAAIIQRERIHDVSRRLDDLAASMGRALRVADALPASLFDRYDFGLSGVPVFDHAPAPVMWASPGCPGPSRPYAAARPCLDGGSLDYG